MKTNFSERAGHRIVIGGGHYHKADYSLWRTLLAFAAVLCAFGSLSSARADLSAPDTAVYGLIVLGTNEVTASTPGFVIEARRANGLPVARYQLGERADAGNFYLLNVKVEELAPLRDGASVLKNETLSIIVSSNGLPLAQQPFTVTERGQVARLDFGSLPTNVLSGFELWALAWGLGVSSQSLDADGDGLSNLEEYILGTDPTGAASQFLLRVARTSVGPRVSFDALQAQGVGYEGLARHYALEQITGLYSGNWQVVPGYEDIIGANQVVVYQASASGSLFFRGKAWLGFGAGLPLDGFRLSVVRKTGGPSISFIALGQDAQGRNRFYTLEHSTNLVTGPWMAVSGYSNLLGGGQTVTYPVSAAAKGGDFYRGRFEPRSP